MNLKLIGLVLVFTVLVTNGKVFDPDKKTQWWKKGVIYQIYTKSFKDSDNDGYGDLKGITSRLDYLSHLGVEIIWLNPIYLSGGKDNGYDVISYYHIDPLYGSMTDFDELVKEVHQRGMYIIMDFVPNHTSDQNKWFVESKRNKSDSNPYRDYYVWRSTNHPSQPPNNWLSFFEGSAWEYNENRQEWYLHQFLKEQPDLNFRNKNVQNELKKIMRFWLEEKNIDGFRVDAAHTFFEDIYLRNEPLVDDNSAAVDLSDLKFNDLNHIFTQNQPETLHLITEWRELINEISNRTNRERMLVTEVYAKPTTVAQYCHYNGKPGANFPFNFQLIELRNHSLDENGILMPHVLMDLIDPWIQAIGGTNCWSSWVIGNHDNSRVASRLSYEYIDMINALNLLLGGTPTTYYGEELGMEDLPKELLNYEDSQDEAGRKQGPYLFWAFSRDYERTPMQWSAKTNTAGFTDKSNVKTWLPVNPNYRYLNVENQLKDKRSHLNVYRQLVKIRQEPSFQNGIFKFAMINKEIFSFIRHQQGYNGFLVAMNFGENDLVVNFHYTDLLPRNAEVVFFAASTEEDSEYLESRFRPGTIISTKKSATKIQELHYNHV